MAGDVIEVTGDKPVQVTGVAIGDRDLTVRNAAGERPVFDVSDRQGAAISCQGRFWVEGITFRDDGTNPLDQPVIEVDGGALRMNNCQLGVTTRRRVSPSPWSWVAANDATDIEIVNCAFLGTQQALLTSVNSRPVEGQRIQVMNNVLLGFWCLRFSHPLASEVGVDFRRNVIVGHTAIASFGDSGAPRLQFFARRTVFVLSQALLLLSQEDLKDRVSWRGFDNIYAIGRHYVQRAPGLGRGIVDHADWLAMTSEKNARAVDVEIDVKALHASDGRPSVRKLAKLFESAALVKGPVKAGPNFEWIGPGEGLERWRRTEEGNVWRAAASLERPAGN